MKIRFNPPVVMGILNATPDSFHGDSRVNASQAVDIAGQMLETGAGIIDIGGQSTRPGAVAVSASEEADRALPVVEAVCKAFPHAQVSTDTWYASVAKAAIQSGARIINDISAGEDDPDMLALAGRLGVTYIAMHKQGQPATMQQNPQYGHVVNDVLDYFAQRQAVFRHHGIYDWVIDPGFGFGKTQAHNFQLLNNLHAFSIFGRPVLAGISRKGMTWKTLGITAAEALNGTTALHMAALMKGAGILRVHDVKEAVECVRLFQALRPENDADLY